MLLGLDAGDSVAARAPASLPEPAAAAAPASPAGPDDALLAESIGHSLARSSAMATLAECERLRARLREGCRRYVREKGRPAPEANLLAP
jgi:hypothetical protein